ncbi:AMP-binding protein [Microbispora corallina]|uniref:Phenazine antibiotic biosynthesis protein n=1 Tax=Microbispora corallina TaxID=83302 RepID=A0ABQ4G278_9ACTN|nr:AMP-binding protein [Microbispora corallina]GIH41135.1 phenazine antibiotic biosynthesis protein [Microbispora corallina]
MSSHADPVLDDPPDEVPDAREFIEAAMRWHFDPDTGSPYWLKRARTLGFDPRRDVHTLDDLRMFPNVANELRDVRVEDLIPRGYGPEPCVVGVYESGGTTGPPKRVVLLADWLDRVTRRAMRDMDERSYPRGVNWLFVGPSGPHIFGELVARQALARGGVRFSIDLDPRWVKKCIAEGRLDEAERYAEHLIDQATFPLETQDAGVLITTPPLLERLARRNRLVDLVNEKISVIVWGGAHMDPDTRHLLRTEVFPKVRLYGMYGSTMILSGLAERAGLTEDDPCVFDAFSPYVSLRVVDPDTGEDVPYGERGQVVMNHVSKGMLLPNNLERDLATRIEGPPGQLGDSVADVGPLRTFENEQVIEGVY